MHRKRPESRRAAHCDGQRLSWRHADARTNHPPPRLGRRIDVVLRLPAAIVVLEFKVGERLFERGAIDPVWDYALDLKNFHAASHAPAIIPVLIATGVTHDAAGASATPLCTSPRTATSGRCA
jgi:hypothetical protein